MSLGFGSVKGSGSSDRVTGPSEALPTQLSFHIWINRNGEGGGGLGRIFDRGSFLFFNNNPNTASTYALGLNSAADTRYRWARPASGGWHPTGFSVDTTSSSNTPTVYQSGEKLTSGGGVTRDGPEMAWPTSSAAWCLGNRASDAIRGWDGLFAQLVVWRTILTDAQFYALQRGIDPRTIRPDALMHYLDLDYNTRDSIGASKWTPTGTKPFRYSPPTQLALERIDRRLWSTSTAISSYTINPSGQLALSGLAPVIKTKVFLPAGVINFSGTAVSIKNKIILPSGNVTLSGSSNMIKEKLLQPLGGINFSGEALPIKSKVI